MALWPGTRSFVMRKCSRIPATWTSKVIKNSCDCILYFKWYISLYHYIQYIIYYILYIIYYILYIIYYILYIIYYIIIHYISYIIYYILYIIYYILYIISLYIILYIYYIMILYYYGNMTFHGSMDISTSAGPPPKNLAIAPCRRRLPEKRQQGRFQVAAPWLQGWKTTPRYPLVI